MLRILCALTWLVTTGAAMAQSVPKTDEQIRMGFAPVVKTTAPAVVNVYAKSRVRERGGFSPFDDPFFQRFFGSDGDFGESRERVRNSLGSGVIVDSKGLIVTNNHVIKGGEDIRVVLADKREFPAKLLLAEERSDLAVLKIDVGDERLASIAIGDSDDLEVGDLVLAIGNPFGVGQTVTNGIVSALARTDVGVSDYQFFIQTDAAINPGNSGGALVNMRGELVGINTAIYSQSGGSIGIGFSIPANMVKTVVQSAEKGGKVQRPWVGAELQDVTADIAESLGLARPEGALVASLDRNSPLAAAGLKRGDVILAVDGRAIESARAFSYRIATAGVGHRAIIEFMRAGKQQQVSMVLAQAPETVARSETLIKADSPFQGLLVANLSPALADELGLHTPQEGVVAIDVKEGPALRFFRPGDVILSVNDQYIKTVADLQQAVAHDPGVWTIQLNRQGETLQLTLR